MIMNLLQPQSPNSSRSLPLLCPPVVGGSRRQGEKSGKWASSSYSGFLSRPLSPFIVQALACLIVLAATTAWAADVQTLPEDTMARHGYTHAARITFEDLNNVDNAATLMRLWPIPTNSYIDRVAFAVTTPFTNNVLASTNLLLCVGVGGSTNAFFTTNQIDGSQTMALSGLTVWALATNMVTPYKATTSTNYVTATISAGASVVDSYTRGEIRIYWRSVEPGRIRF
jgi:hypothetical protein